MTVPRFLYLSLAVFLAFAFLQPSVYRATRIGGTWRIQMGSGNVFTWSGAAMKFPMGCSCGQFVAYRDDMWICEYSHDSKFAETLARDCERNSRASAHRHFIRVPIFIGGRIY